MDLLRAFIAIEIPNDIKKAIAVRTAALQKETGQVVRWVKPENIHLTLKFLGELSHTNLELLTKALQVECGQQEPFEITVSGLGSFPNLRRPHVIWVGLSAPPELDRLQHKIESVTERLGYPTEEKPYSAHLTIGRVREQVSRAEMNRLQSSLSELKIDALGTFTVRTATLFKSDLQPAGPLYTPLFSAIIGI